VTIVPSAVGATARCPILDIRCHPREYRSDPRRHTVDR
jgi:hypothetical protein